MQRLFTLSLLLCLLLTLGAKDKKSRLAFAQISCEQDSPLVVGDSMVVSVYIYSPYKIESISIDDHKLFIRNGKVRRLRQTGRPSQRVTYINSRPYYSVLAAQYVVSATDKGKSELPSLKFKATLLQQQSSGNRSFSPFYGPFDDFFQSPSYKRIETKGRTDEKKLRFIAKPRQTTEQLIKQGHNVM